MLNTEAERSLVHVAVAVIVKDGRVLISKRAQNVHQGGLWEFPGGKVEKGETIEQALFREVQEELGICIHKSHPLINKVHHYSDKSVILETRLVTEFEGKQYDFSKNDQLGLEGQRVEWVRLGQLCNYQFPKANQAIISALRLPQTYLITPDCDNDPAAISQFIEEFTNSIQEQGIVQLRIKNFLCREDGELKKIVQKLCDIADKKKVQVLANSSMLLKEEALNSKENDSINLRILDFTKKIAGIHLNSHHLHELAIGKEHFINDCFVNNYREQYPNKMIAASCHNESDIERANQLKLDFIVISPVQPTESHPEQKAIGWKQFKVLSDCAEMPVFALGGMSLADINLAQQNGAQGISAIRSLWHSLG